MPNIRESIVNDGGDDGTNWERDTWQQSGAQYGEPSIVVDDCKNSRDTEQVDSLQPYRYRVGETVP